MFSFRVYLGKTHRTSVSIQPIQNIVIYLLNFVKLINFNKYRQEPTAGINPLLNSWKPLRG